jgi:hypothetical protein
MARIVLGLAASHAPMMGNPPEGWLTRWHDSDRSNPLLWFRKQRYDFDDLVALRAPENLEQYLTLEERAWRHAAALRGAEALRTVYEEVRPDVLVVIGNDHEEVFVDVTPAFGVYWGAVHENGPTNRPDRFYAADEPAGYPGLPDFGLHMIRNLEADGFDVASIPRTPRQPETGLRVMPHAFGYVFQQLCRGAPPPTLPLHINTFYAPNQPTIERVFAFAEAVTDAIEAWDSELTVGLVASGGLSHFILDEALDRAVLDAFANDLDALRSLDERIYQSGSSEIKNWVPVALAMRRLGARMNLIDYVPCYRSTAGNGHGVAFAYWRP